MINLILCGGSGTRLWPISRTLMPKQFVSLFGEKSLFQLTVERNALTCNSTFIVSNAEQHFLALDQLEEVGSTENHFLLEPVGRNTAPAIALACLKIDPDTIVLVSPSDHLIKKQDAYEKVMLRAKELAEEDYLVTFGITPTHPETGFGYIEANGEDAKRFCEKPDAETAQSYIDQGHFYWNSGMFCFKAGVFLEELAKFSPEMLEACKTALAHSKGEHVVRIQHDDMAAIPADSIDYAVMEKSTKVKVVPSDIGWSDLGSFESLYEELPKDEFGNTTSDRHMPLGSKNNLVLTSDRMVTTLDVENLMIVDTPDALMVSHKGSSQKVKQVVELLKEKGSDLHHVHLTAKRPWGSYAILEEEAGYKIKHIIVRPGARLSLQKHFHRSEHWVVLKGTAEVTLDDEVTLVTPNHSTYIPIGVVHRLTNPGKTDLEIIEVQVGEYTGEDDIVRIQDDYKRSS